MKIWEEVLGHMILEVSPENDLGLPENIFNEIHRLWPEADWLELTIRFESSGYYDPGVYTGPPERCYPACSDEERMLIEVVVSPPTETGYNEKLCQLLNEEMSKQLFNLYEKEIDKVELEWE